MNGKEKKTKSAGIPSVGNHLSRVVTEVEHSVDRSRFRVLGPLEVIRNGQDRTPKPFQQRVLLAILLLNANKLVTTDAIIDQMWGSRPPDSARAAVQMYVCGIRRSLAGDGDPREHAVLKTCPSGYLLVAAPGQLDVSRFRAHLTRARGLLDTGRCVDAAAEFRLALSLWRGRVLADLARWPEYDRYARYLEEERLSALESRIDLDLEHGPDAGLIAELEQLCAYHPYCEGFHRRLMLAYCRSGRRAEALDVYARAQRVLREEVGIEPGQALRAVQRTILQDGGQERRQSNRRR
ncbi:DNA-binding transcriptional activator of the SARP family [Amycolatopsis xylanica]|uniref:DNA-binding transcriptional activator of the SARP family n=1 Tax=Amycolatopsis xylanica TaxID=589385 RepID=A0A1H2W7J8_9PSEU|nr:AfsR/SARP family transcriptional regulator [Amycolatopsis xylanica]SDW76416.1 DNA-binding transcriptional activator of the SARP family [Amycolatopsis xylanica]